VVSSDEESGASRRKLLSAAGGAAAVLASQLATACGSHSRMHVGAIPKPIGETDVGYLNHALDLKHYAVGAYTAATPLLRGRDHAVAKRFLGQDLTHVSELISLIKRADGTPNLPQSTYDLGHPHGTRGILDLLEGAENALVAGYLELLPKVSPGSVRSILGSIIANDAQHLAVLHLQLRRNPIPSAFVAGPE
jgi:hypothetical protein